MTLHYGIKVRGQSVYYADGRWGGRESALLLDEENEARCLRDSLGVPCCLVVLSDARRAA